MKCAVIGKHADAVIQVSEQRTRHIGEILLLLDFYCLFSSKLVESVDRSMNWRRIIAAIARSMNNLFALNVIEQSFPLGFNWFLKQPVGTLKRSKEIVVGFRVSK